MIRTITLLLALLLATSVQAEAETNWTDNLTISGDFRLRTERIDTEDQNRQRIRARILFTAEIEDDLSVGLRIATGSSSSATSTNQTLGDGFGKKGLWLDLAYIDYHPGAYTVTAGKIRQPFYRAGKNQLIWDSDVNPEGVAYTQSVKLSDQDTLTVTVGGFWLDEREVAADARVLGAQAYLKHVLGTGHAIVGVSNYAYEATTDADLDIVEVFGEIKHGPVTLYGSHAQVDTAMAYLVGIKVSKGKVGLGYNYRETLPGAVHGGFDESDFTSKRGHMSYASYDLTKSMKTVVFLYQTDDFRGAGVDLKVKF